MDKRSFLKNVGLMSLLMPLNFVHVRNAVADIEHLDLAEVAANEDFWMKVRGDFDLKPDYINLENGYYCFMPKQTMERQIEHLRTVNYEGSYYMRTVQRENKKKVATGARRRDDEVGDLREDLAALLVLRRLLVLDPRPM